MNKVEKYKMITDEECKMNREKKYEMINSKQSVKRIQKIVK